MKKLVIALIVLGIFAGGFYVFLYPQVQAYLLSAEKSTVENFEGKYLLLDESIPMREFGITLEDNGIINSGDDFNKVASIKAPDKIVNKKKILVEKDKWGTYNEIINNIKYQLSANDNIVFVEYNNVKSIADAAGKLTRNIDLDSAEFAEFLLEPSTASSIGFDETSFKTFFIPVKYEVYSDISKEELFDKMKTYYKDFWTDDRKAKASALGYSQSQVTVLASIVYEEQKVKFDEQSKIAGLYLNRLKSGWKLQADPTVKYAIGDPGIKRLFYKHLEYQSPYNTYLHNGLPPGPISFPESQAIDAVLNHENHEYMYMCAKPEYSGYHNFSKTLSQHNKYAKEYQKWLNSEGIK